MLILLWKLCIYHSKSNCKVEGFVMNVAFTEFVQIGWLFLHYINLVRMKKIFLHSCYYLSLGQWI